MSMKAALAIVSLALLLAGAFGACAEESGNDEAAGIVHRLLLAALAQDPDSLESFPGELPPDLPAAFPVYPDGDIVVSSRELRTPEPTDQPAEGDQVTALYLILMDTADSPSEVFGYYEDALDTDPWQIESTIATPGLQSILFSLIEDPDVTGRLDIARDHDEARTTAVVSIQDAGAEQIEAPAFEVPEGLLLPAQFPQEIPLYEDANIISSAFLREPGQESIEVVFISLDDQSDIIEFYRQALEEAGWDVQDAPVEGLTDRLIFSDPEGTLNGAIQADRFSEEPDYTQVATSIQQDPGRVPEGAEEMPDGGTTAPDEDASPEAATPTSG
jgi:hypothetical protein